ncbi:mucoidy inhibitor MuiA family protein [Anaeromyxobacter sp. Fw109-5]|uniref:mucoidy inhibitor MuiA family protein n=1 Tax=Anaeromyxobacter sp. (strain Fw109-5) TaxID=404589 RepID=UPI0000ED75EE|nr:mucoidy inhibitor MuiA family protein [Anaeromyxobacter sp. Fw109-5]ABS26522.1 putative mucoidy inhibitor A [Anaeromyxobacter sp. Fw109-5]
MRTLALVILSIPALAAAAPALRPPSRIDAVTVYRQSARVTRVAKVELPDGPTRVVLEGLPDELDDDSIRVEGKGAAKARVFGVGVERMTAKEAVTAEARAVEERIERLQDEDRALEDAARAAQARAKFVESLRSTYSEERAKNLAVRGVSVREWAELAGHVERELADAAAAVRKAEVGRRELARRIAQARADLEKVQAKRGRTTKAISVEVEAERGGALELAVSYAVASAGWSPLWDARLAPERATMELIFLGSVWQRTGEDWADVTLAVSTAQPGRGLYVPELEPVYLTEQRGVRHYEDARKSMASAPAAALGALVQERDEVAAEELHDVQLAAATVEHGLLSATFTAPRREAVDGAGQARRIALQRFPLKAELVRVAAPRREAATFLTAKAVNDTGFPLLPGVAGVYVGDEFVGRAPVALTPPGGELELAFGVDDRIEVERRVLERKRLTAGLVSKDDVYRYRVRIEVKNRYATQAAVKLVDLVPVSRDEKIKVAVLDGTTAATKEDPERPGVRIHELALAANEAKVVELRYEVRYPRGLAIAGLE